MGNQGTSDTPGGMRRLGDAMGDLVGGLASPLAGRTSAAPTTTRRPARLKRRSTGRSSQQAFRQAGSPVSAEVTSTVTAEMLRARVAELHPAPSAPSAGVTPAICPLCRGSGWVRSEVGPENGWRVESAPCACQRETLALAQWRRALDASDMTPSLLALTFEGYDPTPDPSFTLGRDAALAWASSLASSLAGNTSDAALPRTPPSTPPSTPPWLVLYGNSGTGKTHLLASAFNLLMARGHYPLYTLVPALLDYVRQGLDASDGGGEYATRFQAVQQAPILILDDLGAEMRTPWSDETLFKLLDHRSRAELPTAVGSNLLPEHLELRIGSRLQDRALSVALLMSGPDYRLSSSGRNGRKGAR